MSSQKHKHFVALPVFLIAMLCVATSDRLIASVFPDPVHASVIALRASTQPTTWSNGAGLSIAIDAHSALTVDSSAMSTTLYDGSAIVSAMGFATIQLQQTTIQLIHSSAFVLRDTTSATVVALAGPVVVRNGTQQTLLPRGYQLRIAGPAVTLSRVPIDWLQQKIRLVPPAAEVVLTPAANDALAALAVSQCHAASAAMSAMETSAVVASIFDDTTNAFDCSHALEQLVPFDTSVTDPLLLFALLSHGYRVDSLLSQIDIPLSMDEDFALSVLQEQQVVHRLLPDALIALFVRSVERTASSHPVDAQQLLVSSVDTLSTTLDDAGFPESAKQWQQVSAQLRTFIAPLLPPNVTSHTSSSASVTQKPVDTRVYDPAEITALARQQLQSSALMFTAKTSITYDSQARVRIENAYIATAHGDSEMSCTFDTDTQQVSAIVLGSIPLPNSVSLAQLANSFK